MKVFLKDSSNLEKKVRLGTVRFDGEKVDFKLRLNNVVSRKMMSVPSRKGPLTPEDGLDYMLHLFDRYYSSSLVVFQREPEDDTWLTPELAPTISPEIAESEE